MQEYQISHVFCTLLLLTEEDMAPSSRTFRKNKNAEEESIRAVIYYYYSYFFWDGRRVGKLDNDIANMTAMSLNFWLINLSKNCAKNNERYPPRVLYSAVFSAIS